MTRVTKKNFRSVNEVFGSDLPQESSDERDPDAMRGGMEREEWLRDNVPPHHG